MKIFSVVLTGGLALAAVTSISAAHNDSYVVNNDVFHSLGKTGAVAALLDGLTSTSFWTPVDTVGTSVSTLTLTGHLRAKQKLSWGIVDCELNGRIDNGVFSTTLSRRNLDALVGEWERLYGGKTVFAPLATEPINLSFVEGEGFSWQMNLKLKNTYLFLQTIPLQSSSTLVDLSAAVKKIPAFVQVLERDKRASVVMHNNKSGRLPFISIDLSTGPVRLWARHPMHSVAFVPDQNDVTYSYIDNVIDVATLPDVKRVVRTKEAEAFMKAEGESVRISMTGSDKAGYNFFLFGPASHHRLAGRVERKKVTFSF